MKIKEILQRLLYFFPDILILLLFSFYTWKYHNFDFKIYFIISIAFVIIKIFQNYIGYRLFLTNKISFIKTYIENFKQGKYSIIDNNDNKPGFMSEIIKDLNDLGKYFENMVLSQKDEIEKFKEFYNNIVLSMSSYFLVINNKGKIIFANKSFSQNFNLNNDDIMNNSISDLFYFSGGNIPDAIDKVSQTGDPIVLKHTRLLSKNRIAIIADIKISRITIHGNNQVVIAMDDITSKCRNDYQISLISQISESIQKDEEIDRVFYAILTAVTSGSGLGFNRAMLFSHDPNSNMLEGKMAVGPDSIEEAVQIWEAVQDEKIDFENDIKETNFKERKGKIFYEQVTNTKYSISEDNILVKVFKDKKIIHVKDAWNDTRLSLEVREFLNVTEFVAIPLIAGNKSIGIIIVDNKYNQAPIWEDNVELLRIFATQASLSIESCQNLNQVKKRMNRIKNRQEAIIESEKMAAVGRIAAHIAHEIRNPLVTVGGYARRIIQTVTKGAKINPAPVKQAAEVILKESERLEKILSNVMDFTRPSPFIKEYNNLNDIILDTIILLQNVFQERKIEIKTQLEKEMPLIKSDFNQLKQVMLNLVQNAMDATPPEGEILISSSINKNKVVISISDTGSGISEDNIQSLFEPFFTTKVTGVGLGLAVVKKIITDHNGDIYATNKITGGAEFTIELPIPI